MKPTRAEFLEQALLLMRTPYIWGSRDGAGVDCSGLVALALFRASAETIDLRRGWWTDKMWTDPSFRPTFTPKPGDLCFYGGQGDDVTHVTILLVPPGPGVGRGMVLGACGGGKATTTILEASRSNAMVKPKRAIRYRNPDDFRGYRSMESYLREE